MCPSRESNQGPTGYYIYASPISYKTTSPNHRSSSTCLGPCQTDDYDELHFLLDHENHVTHSDDSHHNVNRMDSNLGLLPGSDPANSSDSQTTIRYRSNSAMDEDFDDSADTTTIPDALTTDTKLRQKLRRRAKQKDRRKIAWLQKSNLNTQDKDEML